MKHLLPTTNSQTLKIIPRVYSVNVTMKLRDDSTNETVTILPTATKVGNYIDLQNVFDLKEGHFYDLKIYNGQGAVTDLDIIYRDKIFATTQTINQETNNYYKPNEGAFISESGDNDFIFI